MRNVENVRNWVQIVQGVFVIAGVIFAVWQFEFQLADRAQKRVAETDQRLRELERDPVHSAVLYLTEIATQPKAAGQTSAVINGDDFVRKTEPLRTYFAAMTRCIALETCDRAITQDGLCRLVATYVTMATQIPWNTTKIFSLDAFDPIYGIGGQCLTLEAKWSIVGREVSAANKAWEDAERDWHSRHGY